MAKDITEVSIKFRAGAYGAYRSMNNKVWYALAEFVDNALQSYLAKKEQILAVNPDTYQFTVTIDVDLENDLMRISDNAAGIDYQNFIRAFEPANIPLDTSGLSEFGMGMKIAAIWFADRYELRSSALGEKVERHVLFDLEKVMKEEKEVLDVKSKDLDQDAHFTEVTLYKLSENAPSNRGQQLSRIKMHLTSIYRKFLMSGEMRLVFNGEKLTYDAPEILTAPFVDDPGGEDIYWKKEIDFEVGPYKVKGFIGLLKEMSKYHCGLSLFRRGRVIEGSHDEKYHPTIVCGQRGSPRDKRLFGELELQGFKVSFDKGRFTQVDELQEVLSLVKKELNRPDFNLLKQGDKYIKPKTKKDRTKLIKESINREKKKSHSADYKAKRDKTFASIKPTPELGLKPTKTTLEHKLDQFTEVFTWDGKDIVIDIEFIKEKGRDLYMLYVNDEAENSWKGIINLYHDFFLREDIQDPITYQSIITVIKGLLFAEIISQSQGTKKAGYIRHNLSRILKSL